MRDRRVRLGEVNGNGLRQVCWVIVPLTLSLFFASWHGTHSWSLAQMSPPLGSFSFTCTSFVLWSFIPTVFGVFTIIIAFYLSLFYACFSPQLDCKAPWCIDVLVIYASPVAPGMVPGTRRVFSNCLLRRMESNWTQVGREKDQGRKGRQ